jgi:molybdopterin converting factor subunit 1
MTIRVRLFAILKDRAAGERLTLDLPVGATVQAALDEIDQRFPALKLSKTRVAAALDMEYVDPKTPLHDGAELALIPPVSGG